MSRRWTDRESIRLVEVVESLSGVLITKRRKPRKTYPEVFWVKVAKAMQDKYRYDRSAVACRKKFQSLQEEIQPMLPTKPREPLVYRRPAQTSNPSAGKLHPSSPDMFFLDDLFSRGVCYGPATITVEVVGKTEDGRQLARLQHEWKKEHWRRNSKGVSHGNN